MRQKKRDRAWFERKVEELGQVIEKIPRERQLELFETELNPQAEQPAETKRERRKEG